MHVTVYALAGKLCRVCGYAGIQVCRYEGMRALRPGDVAGLSEVKREFRKKGLKVF